jgi:hypothetical protein
MGVDDPTPTISGNCAAIAPTPTGVAEIVGDDFPVLQSAVAVFARTVRLYTLFRLYNIFGAPETEVVGESESNNCGREHRSWH